MGSLKPTGRFSLLGVAIDATDYESAVAAILAAARERRPCAVSALAVHGVMTGVLDSAHRYRLNHLDIVAPDGQPVRWALNLLYRTGLSDRVYGPELTHRVLKAAAEAGISVYFYGSTDDVLTALAARLPTTYPALRVAGMEPSKFRIITSSEKADVVSRILAADAQIIFVGLGCPRQEVFAYEYRNDIGRPLLAVGAAFDYHAGLLREPAPWIQRAGLQWLYRLVQDPRRLWRRYLLLNPNFVVRVAAQKLGLWKPGDSSGTPPPSDVSYG